MQRQRQGSDYKALALCSGPCTASLEGEKKHPPQPNELTTRCVQALWWGNGKSFSTRKGILTGFTQTVHQELKK